MALKFGRRQPCAVCGEMTWRGCGDNEHRGKSLRSRAFCKDHRLAVGFPPENPNNLYFLCVPHFGMRREDPAKYGPVPLVADPGD